MKRIPLIISNIIFRWLARRYGFVDPTTVLGQLGRFGKPSEIWVPIELLRHGFLLHMRGLINSQAIQHNLDWIWPFWVVRQFLPNDEGFIPRAFNLTHINLTHRNWTAVGVPYIKDFPIVDPCGLLTPFWDSWSVEAWVIKDDEIILMPERWNKYKQDVLLDNMWAIRTMAQDKDVVFQSLVWVEMQNQQPVCKMSFKVSSPTPVKLAITLRPYNPEGISFISQIDSLEQRHGWKINKKEEVLFDTSPQKILCSNYQEGDVKEKILDKEDKFHTHAACTMGMASAAAIYPMSNDKEVKIEIPLRKDCAPASISWPSALEGHCQLRIPQKDFQRLYDIALRSLIILHNEEELYPGPFTYKFFWFRDAAFFLQALLVSGLVKNVEHVLDKFSDRQTAGGYFISQNGEWDSNGQALWSIEQFSRMMNKKPKPEWHGPIISGARWIKRKRKTSKYPNQLAALMPAGFSAEHFGPSDHYYWDNFWCVAGLKSAANLLENPKLAQEMREEACDLDRAITKSLEGVEKFLGHRAVPAAQDRRMDSAAIGNLVASYPLQVWTPSDIRMTETVEYLLKHWVTEQGFYHAISHSGINAYLTLHLAQVLLRNSDERFYPLVESIAKLASPTGQWPEAVHPRTKGGCMGDGQHAWASAEWVIMMRNMFVREEIDENKLILCSGIPAHWLKPGETLFLGPTPTLFGPVSVTVVVHSDHVDVSWQATWHKNPDSIEVHLLNEKKIISEQKSEVQFKKHALLGGAR